MTRTLVRLEPPYTRSMGRCDDAIPLTRGPRLVRTGGMGRWHRTRSGVHLLRHDRSVLHVWCGQGVQLADAITCTMLPAGEPLCGTCEGRAIGAGHPATGTPLDVALLFTPRSQAPPPARCPSHRLYEHEVAGFAWGSVFACPVCGVATRARAAGGPYNSRVVIEGHAPGPDLYLPCPFHRWDWPALVDGRVRCGCGAPVRAVEGS
jgi:hypothetical protein